MYSRRVMIEAVDTLGARRRCALAQIDSFAMRNFTNDAVFDDTLPVEDGLMEIGARVPVALLRERMEDWFRRKQYLAEGERLEIVEVV